MPISEVSEKKRTEVSRPMTIRLRRSAEKDILDLMENEGFSAKSDVFAYVTRCFMAEVFGEIVRSAEGFLDDEGRYREYLSSIADRYTDFYDNRYRNDDVKDSFTLSFRFSDELYDTVREFNNGTLRYHNMQEFVRVAFGWYVSVSPGLGSYNHVRDMWKRDVSVIYRHNCDI